MPTTKKVVNNVFDCRSVINAKHKRTPLNYAPLISRLKICRSTKNGRHFTTVRRFQVLGQRQLACNWLCLLAPPVGVEVSTRERSNVYLHKCVIPLRFMLILINIRTIKSTIMTWIRKRREIACSKIRIQTLPYKGVFEAELGSRQSRSKSIETKKHWFFLDSQRNRFPQRFFHLPFLREGSD